MISLALTIPTLAMCAAVVHLWWGEALRALTARNRTATQWFVLGVAIGFAGSFADNAYWGVTWLSDYYQWDCRGFLFWFGVFPNIPFRQCAGLLAAYCHVVSAVKYKYESDDKYKSYATWMFVIELSLVLGLLSSLLLLFC